jgi:hypothetical protein
MEPAKTPLNELLKQSVARFNAMTPEQQAAMREAQRQSFVHSVVNWPKPKYHWKDGVKVYHSFEDYCND